MPLPYPATRRLFQRQSQTLYPQFHPVGQFVYLAQGSADAAGLTAGISTKLPQLAGTERLSEEPARGLGQLVGLIDHHATDAGDEVIIPEPCFVSYAPEVAFAQGSPVTVPTYLENDFQVTAETVEQYITPRTKALLLGYPNNPTGAVMSRSEMEKIADLGDKVDIALLVEKGLVRKGARVKILGQGQLFSRCHVAVHKLSQAAKDKIEAVGGRWEEIDS